MPPDLNSLPPSSPSPSTTPLQPRAPPAEPHPRTMSQSQSHSPSHTPPHSLAAAATMNAGIQNEDLRRQSSGSMRREVERARRRSSIRMNLNLNDPGVPAPGEMQRSPSTRSRGAPSWPHSPHHERAPSLGELHQELESEQEGQVNRLLSLIRTQQSQLQSLQLQPGHHPSTTSAVDDSTPTSERSLSMSLPLSNPPPPPQSQSQPHHPPIPLSRSSSSHFGSPSPAALDQHPEWISPPLQPRDESAFYQAETQNLTRENQMLKMRIRELERQLADTHPSTSGASGAHEPATASNLHTSPPISRRETGVEGQTETEAGAETATGS